MPEDLLNILNVALKAQLLVLTDSLAQPGLQLFQALAQLHSRLSTKPAAILCAQTEPDLVLESLDLGQNVTLFDAFHSRPVAAPTGHTAFNNVRHLPDVDRLLDQLDTNTDTLFVDSLSELALRTSVRQSMLWLKNIQAQRPQLKIVCLVSSDLDTSPSLTTALTSSPLSRTFCRLSIHPTSLLHALKVVYNLTPATPAVHSFLYRFQARGWGGHGFRSEDADEIEQCASTDLLGSSATGAKAVLQWELRGHELLRLVGGTTAVGSSGPSGAAQAPPPTKSGEAPTKAESLKRGLVGLQQSPVDVLEVIPLREVTSTFTALPQGANEPQDTTVESISATLPFNLSLTPAQRAEKESTVLPFHREAGEAGAEAIIHYDADSADDIDEEEGDED